MAVLQNALQAAILVIALAACGGVAASGAGTTTPARGSPGDVYMTSGDGPAWLGVTGADRAGGGSSSAGGSSPVVELAP